MRDPKRIKQFCDRLAKIWESQCPDWRFGQLVCNVLPGDTDPFFIEDDKMMEKIEKYFRINNK